MSFRKNGIIHAGTNPLNRQGLILVRNAAFKFVDILYQFFYERN